MSSGDQKRWPRATAVPPAVVPDNAHEPDDEASSGSLQARAQEHAGTLRGILFLIAATLLFASQDAISKSLSMALPASQIVFVRYIAFSVFALAFVAWRERDRGGVRAALKAHRPWLQIVRAACIAIEITIFIFGLRHLGVAEMHAVFSCFPLIITALSVPLLGEQVGWRRWLAVAVGFVGTLIIVRPGSGVFSIYVLIPILCAFIYALYNILTRLVSRDDGFGTSFLYFGLTGLVLMSVPAVVQWQSMDASTAMLLAVLCCTSILGHVCLILALSLAPAVILQPFNYLILVWAMIIGFLVYGEVLDRFEVIGAAVVVASGLYIGVREIRRSA